jgi:uncharacterized membrane protein YdjX (TVP38/TMEM64 family)
MSRLTTRQYILTLIIILSVGIVVLLLNRDDLFMQAMTQLQDIKTRSDALRDEILAHGTHAPFFFIAVQIVQVVFAPIPGEASGLVGGYLFGTWPCFIYSTIGLTIGSAVAFGGGRLLSSFFTEKFQHTRFYEKFNVLVSRGDYLIPFLLFILPGFPKDSLSYLLGMSAMPLPVFMFITTIGRMPGTLLLSAHGAEAYNGDYLRLAILIISSAVLVVPAMVYRHRLLDKLKEWQAKRKNQPESKIK